MKNLAFSIVFGCFILTSPHLLAEKLLVQVQLKNYDGEKAYSVLYLVNPKGRYEKTLWVYGDETEYQEEGLSRWWKYQTRKPQNIDAITGASINSGDRYRVTTSLDKALIDKGYKLRVETAVEDKTNETIDTEIALTKANSGKKIKGNGWINYIRYKW